MLIAARISNKVLIFVMCLLTVSSMMILKGCGSEKTGGCSENAAPAGATIVALSSDLGAPFIGDVNCYGDGKVSFVVQDQSGNPMNDICVEVSSGPFNTFLARHTTNDPACTNIADSSPSSLVLTTDDSGVISIDLAVIPTAVGQTFFVNAVSGAAIGAQITTAATTTVLNP